MSWHRTEKRGVWKHDDGSTANFCAGARHVQGWYLKMFIFAYGPFSTLRSARELHRRLTQAKP